MDNNLVERDQTPKAECSISDLSPQGDADLKNILLEWIEVEQSSDVIKKLSAQPKNDLSLNERYELIQAAQKTNHHELIVFLKKSLNIKLYLGIPPTPFGEAKDVLIGQEPLNTTGDFYHVLAYVALSKALGYDIPKLAFSYEETVDKTTELTYLRNLVLLEALGMKGFLKEDFDPKVNKLARACSNGRRLALREKIDQGQFYLIDQKATTAILAEQYILFGQAQISKKIRSVLSQYSKELPREVLSHVERFSKKQVDVIRESKKPFVILHLRSSGSAKSKASGFNAQQDLADRFSIEIGSHLWEKGYDVLFVRSASQDAGAVTYSLTSKEYRAIKKESINPFLLKVQPRRSVLGDFYPPTFSQLVDLSGQRDRDPYVDLGKLLHLDFFLRLYSLSVELEASGRKIRVIGNTSGTTDCISFLGHDLLNIHKFPENAVSLEYQGYRMLMQLTFMSVMENAKRTLSETLGPFLEGRQIRPKIDFSPKRIGSLTLTGKANYNLDFAVLLCVLGWLDKPPNTDAKDKVSAELLPCAQPVFDHVKARFAQDVAAERIKKFKKLLVDTSEPIDALSGSFASKLSFFEAVNVHADVHADVYFDAITAWGSLDPDSDTKEATQRSLDDFSKSKNAADFRKNIADHGLAIQSVQGDGNCFFHSILHQLSTRYPDFLENIKAVSGLDEVTHDLLRRLASGTLKALNNSAGVGEAYQEDFATYVQGQASVGAWVEGEIIRATANVLGVTLVLLNSNSSSPTILAEGRGAVLYLGYQVGVHFDALTGESSEELKMMVAEKQNSSAPSQQVSLEVAWHQGVAGPAEPEASGENSSIAP